MVLGGDISDAEWIEPSEQLSSLQRGCAMSLGTTNPMLRATDRWQSLTAASLFLCLQTGVFFHSPLLWLLIASEDCNAAGKGGGAKADSGEGTANPWAEGALGAGCSHAVCEKHPHRMQLCRMQPCRMHAAMQAAGFISAGCNHLGCSLAGCRIQLCRIHLRRMQLYRIHQGMVLDTSRQNTAMQGAGYSCAWCSHEGCSCARCRLSLCRMQPCRLLYS